MPWRAPMSGSRRGSKSPTSCCSSIPDMDTTVDQQATWPDAIHAHFRRARIRQVGYVPDAGHSRLIQRCIEDPNIIDVVLTTEEEGSGLVPGAALGRERSPLLMPS